VSLGGEMRFGDYGGCPLYNLDIVHEQRVLAGVLIGSIINQKVLPRRETPSAPHHLASSRPSPLSRPLRQCFPRRCLGRATMPPAPLLKHPSHGTDVVPPKAVAPRQNGSSPCPATSPTDRMSSKPPRQQLPTGQRTTSIV